MFDEEWIVLKDDNQTVEVTKCDDDSMTHLPGCIVEIIWKCSYCDRFNLSSRIDCQDCGAPK